MEVSKQESPFKQFQGKAVLIITQSDFKYHTDSLQVFPKHVQFTDKYGCSLFLSNSEIKFLQEERK